MSGFSQQWLALREPVDHAARSEEVLSAISHYFINDSFLAITDIGCGTGSGLRALKTFLSQKTRWHLIDNDETLLHHAREALGQTHAVDLTVADLSESLEPIFSGPCDLVTTSAFLDLVSEDWLASLVSGLKARNLPFYAALTYDGRSECEPRHNADDKILDAINRHQKTDKGFGPALGPQAFERANKLFQEAGYEILCEQSDWNATHRHGEFQQLLFKGWHEAACEMEPLNKDLFDNWLAFHNTQIDEGLSSVTVGHMDLFAIPAIN